jgi:hypothetical protein
MSPDQGSIRLNWPGTLNRYVYALNDPVNMVDLDGLEAQCVNSMSGNGRSVSACTVTTPPPPPVPLIGGGGGGRAVRAHPTVREADDRRGRISAWDSLDSNCRAGLATAMSGGAAANNSRLAALNRASGMQGQMMAAVAGTNIPWEMLAAIGIRESGFRNVAQTNGEGRGIFQIDLGAHPNVTEAQAMDPPFAVQYAAQLLVSNHARLAASHPNLNASQLLQATEASYNFGTGNITGNPNAIDRGSTGNNYGSNVMNLMHCFDR